MSKSVSKTDDPISMFAELMHFVVSRVVSNLVRVGANLFNRYVLKKEQRQDVVKIEKTHLANSRTTLAEEAIGYSVTRKRNILASELKRSDHTAIVGASGAGKTVLLDTLMYDDMRTGKPVVYLDPKGDNETLQAFINMCKITGREYAVFSEYYSGAGETAINPVKDGSTTNIVDRIFNSFIWSEEHYAQICYDALEDAVSRLKENQELVTIKSIYLELEKLTQGSKDNPALYKADEIKGIISRLKKYVQSDYGPKLTGDKALSFSEIRKSKKCVYIGLSVLGYSQMARSLGKMILGDVAYCAYKTYKGLTPAKKSKLTPLGIYIDELSAIITPDEFIELLNKVRGAKMELTFAFQSPSDIKKVDQQLLVQVLENTSNWFVFKQRMKDGAALFAESIGTHESVKQTVRVEDGEELAQGSQRKVEEMIAHSNIIKNLAKGQCIMLRHYPTRLDLLNVKYIDPKILEENITFLEKQGVIEKEVQQEEEKENSTGKTFNI